MWRLFPPDADRPWRQVFVMVDHELRVRLRSWWFRALLLGPPLLMIAMPIAVAVISHSNRSPVLFVVPDAAVRAHYAKERRADVAVSDAHPGRTEGLLAVVHVEGSDPVHPLVRVAWVGTDGRKEADRITTEVVESVRRTVVLAPLDAAIAAEWERSNGTAIDALGELAELDELRRTVPPVAWLIGGWFGCFTGNALATAAYQARTTSEASVLRVGTPPLVLWLGSLLQALVIQSLFFLAAWPVPAFALLVFLAVVGPDPKFFSEFGPLALHCVALTTVGAIVGAVCWAGLASATKTFAEGSFTGKLLSFVAAAAPWLLMVWLYEGDTVDHVPTALAWTPAPVLGPGMALYALNLGASPLWLVGSLLLQIPYAVLALRLGAWAYGLDEPPWDRFVRLRRAGGSPP